jgi:hypothetical protein
MSGLKGDVSSLAKLSANLRALPRVVAQKVTTAAADALTQAARETFDAREDAYGQAWEPRADGARATLRKSGSLASRIHYIAIGTKLRVALGVAYAKYVVGRRRIFPAQGGALPASYVRTLQRIAADVCRQELGR